VLVIALQDYYYSIVRETAKIESVL
jgi:hypothetical protein